MSLLGSILATGANFIPGAGPFISAGIGIADKAIGMAKQKKQEGNVAQDAKERSVFASRTIPTIPDMNSVMFGSADQSVSSNTDNILGKSTYLSEKFGIGKQF